MSDDTKIACFIALFLVVIFCGINRENVRMNARNKKISQCIITQDKTHEWCVAYLTLKEGQ